MRVPLAASVFTVIAKEITQSKSSHHWLKTGWANTALWPSHPPYKPCAAAGAGPARQWGSHAARPRPQAAQAPPPTAAGLRGPLSWPRQAVPDDPRAGAGAGAGGAGFSDRPGRGRSGAIINLFRSRAWARETASGAGGRGGEPGVNFHLSHLFRPARKSESLHRGAFRPVRASRVFCARSGSQTLTSDSLPAPTPTLSPDSLGNLFCPRLAATRHQPGLSLGRRVTAPKEDGPARPSLRG